MAAFCREFVTSPRPRNLGRVPRPRNLGRVPTGPHLYEEGEQEIDGGLVFFAFLSFGAPPPKESCSSPHTLPHPTGPHLFREGEREIPHHMNSESLPGLDLVTSAESLTGLTI